MEWGAGEGREAGPGGGHSRVFGRSQLARQSNYLKLKRVRIYSRHMQICGRDYANDWKEDT